MEGDDTYAWDDGHVWHVYVEEPTGERTSIFSQWVQFGRVDGLLARLAPDQTQDILLIVTAPAFGVDIYAVAYQEPGRFRAVEAYAVETEGGIVSEPTPDEPRADPTATAAQP